MNNEITVAEYSKITGLSRKTIYEKIKKGKLETVEKRIDNRPVKFIKLNIPVDEFRTLATDGEAETKAEVKTVNEVNEVSGVNEENNPVNEVNNPVNEVKEQGTEGEKELAVPLGKASPKEPQTTTEEFLLQEIKDLREQIKEKDRQLLEFANKFAELAQQSNMIAEKAIHTTGQAQILQAVDKQQHGKVIEAGEPTESQEEPIGYKEPKDGEAPKSFWKKLADWFSL